MITQIAKFQGPHEWLMCVPLMGHTWAATNGAHSSMQHFSTRYPCVLPPKGTNMGPSLNPCVFAICIAHVGPSYQQSWYSLRKINRSVSSMWKLFNYLRYLSVAKWKSNVAVLFPTQIPYLKGYMNFNNPQTRLSTMALILLRHCINLFRCCMRGMLGEFPVTGYEGSHLPIHDM